MNTSNFIGLGVEKAATSWIFACLYEHPEVCIPIKEINFFSEDELWQQGKQYYESIFSERCNSPNLIKGEFSTSYFFLPGVANRIKDVYPNAKLIVNLRNPIDRAFSNYVNDLKAGAVDTEISFEKALKAKNYYLDQGHYKEQLERYFELFDRNQIKVLVYDDLDQPLEFIQSVFSFLEVNDSFVPVVLNEKINTARIPGNLTLEYWNNRVAKGLQKNKLGEKIWWQIKKSRIPEVLRKINTKKETELKLKESTRKKLRPIFEEDIKFVEDYLQRKLNW